jgi:hypothetical protein
MLLVGPSVPGELEKLRRNTEMSRTDLVDFRLGRLPPRRLWGMIVGATSRSGGNASAHRLEGVHLGWRLIRQSGLPAHKPSHAPTRNEMTKPKTRSSRLLGFFAEGLDVPVAVCVSIASIAIAVLETTHLIHLSEETLRQATVGAFGAVLLCLSIVMTRQHNLSKKVGSVSDQMAIDRVRGLVSDVDPLLREILGPAIDERLRNLETLLSRQTATFSNSSAFVHFWAQTLVKYPRKKYCATSLARDAFFWRYEEAIKAMTEVLAPRALGRRGKIRRIFLLDTDAELRSLEARSIMDRHADLGVDVRTMITGVYDKELFLCAEDGSITWDVFLEGSGTFREARVTTDRAHVLRNRDAFERMWKAADVYSTSSRRLPELQ